MADWAVSEEGLRLPSGGSLGGLGNLQYEIFRYDHFFRVVVHLYTPLYRYTCPPCTGIHVYLYTPVQVYMHTPPL